MNATERGTSLLYTLLNFFWISYEGFEGMGNAITGTVESLTYISR